LEAVVKFDASLSDYISVIKQQSTSESGMGKNILPMPAHAHSLAVH
jgi:hypothetical protein